MMNHRYELTTVDRISNEEQSLEEIKKKRNETHVKGLTQSGLLDEESDDLLISYLRLKEEK